MFFLPYKDDNPTRRFTLVNWCLIAANLWVFFSYQFPLEEKAQVSYFSNFGFIPFAFFKQFAPLSLSGMIWEWATVFTSMFSHGGIIHLLGNMLFLYLYGDNVEDAMGKLKYIAFFILCGICAALAQGFMDPGSKVPMVGASGAISGVIAGYLLLYPRANVRVFYWFIIFVGTIYLPAYILLGFWVFEQIIALPESMKAAGGVAIAAHLGGFAAGIVLTPIFKRKEIKLFQKANSRAFSRKSRRI
jgi:membrane associated rhomboid family serine protease